MSYINLLLVEDNEDDYELTRELLSSKKVKITWTQTLSETIEALEKEKYDVILLDLGVSDSQGLQTFESIAGCINNPPPVIVFSGNDDDEIAQEAIIKGAQDYLVKGTVTSELLMRSMKYAMERHKIEKQLRNSNENLIALNEELTKAKDQACEASKLKSEFLANLSHEVRTPLGGIVGLANLLIDETDQALIDDFHQALLDSSTTLMNVVNDMLDLSRLEAGMMSVKNVNCDIRNVIQQVVNPIAPTAKLKDILLTMEITETVPKSIVIDELRLRQILLNFLHNAVKFTNQGFVALQVSYDLGAKNLLKVAVSDTGIGIPAHAQTQIFEPFVQADGSTSRIHGGSGLGLAISKKSAELMGGQVGVQSEVGKGTMFWLHVPAPVGT